MLSTGEERRAYMLRSGTIITNARTLVEIYEFGTSQGDVGELLTQSWQMRVGWRSLQIA